jgi:hypothetical protein
MKSRQSGAGSWVWWDQAARLDCPASHNSDTAKPTVATRYTEQVLFNWPPTIKKQKQVVLLRNHTDRDTTVSSDFARSQRLASAPARNVHTSARNATIVPYLESTGKVSYNIYIL